MVFFFKQKTAYEMRISDRSSDVCSSDLASTDGTGAVSNDSTGAAAGGTFLFDALNDVVDLTVNVPTTTAFVTIPASGTTPAAVGDVYADQAACADSQSATAASLTLSTTNPRPFSPVGVPVQPTVRSA